MNVGLVQCLAIHSTNAIITPVKFVYPLLAVLIAVFAIAPLEYPGAFQSHTGLLASYNLINLDQNPAQFWNWAPTVGRAFDLFRMDGALPYWVAEIFHWFGFSYLDAIKLVYALAWLASGLTMYALARKWFSAPGALLAATVYVYLPYHIATVYVRGAFAESVMWAVMPLAMFVVASQPSIVASRRKMILRLLPFALLFLIQPGMAIAFTLVVIIIAAIWHGRSAIGNAQLAIGGLLLGALLALPAILRYGANILRDGFSANFVLPFQLFSSLWGFDTPTGSYLDKFPFQLGVVPIGLAIVAVALAWKSNQANIKRLVAIFLGATIALCGLTFEIAAPLWNALGILVASPWQLLALAGFALALVAGASIEFDLRLTRPAMLAFFVALPAVASYSYLAPRYLDANPTRPPIAIFGNHEIALLDYRIVGPLRHGATVRVQLTWQALRQVDHDYTVFVHAVDDRGTKWAEEDSKPQEGTLPTLKWMPGQVVSDTHTIQINIDGPSEGYHLELGIYQAGNGQRALMDNGNDFLILPRPGDPEPTITDQVRPKP